MLINVERDLSRLEVLETGWVLRAYRVDVENPDAWYVLASIEHPSLILDTANLDSDRQALIATIYRRPDVKVEVRYDDIEVVWHKLPGTWMSNLDSLVHLSGQAKSPAFTTSTRVADVFTGLGIAGKHAIAKGAATDVVFSDIEPNCVRSADYNTNGMSARRRFVVGAGLSSHDSEPYELILAGAIPATPVPDGYGGRFEPIVHGTEGALRLIHDAPQHLGPNGALIASYSSVGRIELEDAITRAGGMRTELTRREVGYDERFLDDPRWVELLLERGGLRRSERGLVHDVIVNEIRYA